MEQRKTIMKEAENTCTEANGIWLPGHNECELNAATADNPQLFCTETLKGNYNECASACRHDKEAQFCTQNCILLCTIPTKKAQSLTIPTPSQRVLKARADACTERKGVWLPEHKECEMQNIANTSRETFCTKTLNGTYNQCASQCRHDKDSESCAEICVPVCTVEARAEHAAQKTMTQEEKREIIAAIREKIEELKNK